MCRDCLCADCLMVDNGCWHCHVCKGNGFKRPVRKCDFYHNEEDAPPFDGFVDALDAWEVNKYDVEN